MSDLALFASDRVVFDLCGGIGSWSEPYRKAGYDVKLIDPCTELGDVRLMPLPARVHGILAAPPCTHLSLSGARWWEEKGEAALLSALSIVDACLRLALMACPAWWVLENPVGRLGHFLGPHRYSFNPRDFAGYPEGATDTYTKRTLLWGEFNHPEKRPREITDRRIHTMGPGPDRAAMRSVTPAGFAQAFFEANP